MKFSRIIDIAAFVMIIVGLYFAFIFAPTEKIMGIIQKIFYFHVASAWIAFFAFFITFICSILLLIRGNLIFDEIASASVELGVIFCSIVLLTGPLWARPVWGVWWTWDPRLTTTLILWFVYVGYIMLRKFTEEEDKRARFSAALGIIGFIDVPVVFLSIRWWRTIHPNVLQKGGGGLHPDMKTALFVSLGAFTLLYISLLIKRVQIMRLEKKVNIIEANKRSS
jgi:heme exporter protein C